MSEKLLQQIFKKVYGKPSWGVHKSDYSIISFDFGKPKLHVKEVVQPTKSRNYPRRIVRVHGDWNLWIYSCDWEIRQNDCKICDSSNSKWPAEKIIRGCGILDGQILTNVVVSSKNLVTDFHFDLGGHLQTKPYKKKGEPDSMWSLFCPNGRVFSLDSDGNYSYASGKTPGVKILRKPFVFDLQ
jgi:hypothetical protein